MLEEGGRMGDGIYWSGGDEPGAEKDKARSEETESSEKPAAVLE